jgi:hypothetical protein
MKRQAFEILGVPWPIFLAETIGTALLIGVGLSFVIINFGQGSPVANLVPSAGLRRALTGFLFGCTGALMAVSPLEAVSAANAPEGRGSACAAECSAVARVFGHCCRHMKWGRPAHHEPAQ